MVSMGKHPLFDWPPDTVQRVRKLNNLEKPGRMEDAVNLFEEWIQKQEHFTKKDFSKDYLERCIIASKGSVEKAKNQLDKLCTMRTLLPQFFSKHNAKIELKEILEMGTIVLLPQMTKDLCRIYVVKLNAKVKYIQEKSLMEFFQLNIIICEYVKAQDYANGFIILHDYSDVNIMDLVAKLNPVYFQQYMEIITGGFGTRLKAIHFLTQSKAIDLLVKIIRPFLSPKIANRIYVHKNIKEMHTFLPKDILPVEYEGKEKSIDQIGKLWIEEISSEKHVEYMRMMNKACTNEKLRQADKFNNDYMGMPGSFRNLKVD